MSVGTAAGLKLVAFDLDGTLVDSAPDLCYCLGAALASMGLGRPDEAQTRSWVGGGVELLLRRALAWAAPEDGSRLFPAAFAEFSACYRDNLFVRSRLYAGVADTLAELAAQGLRLACITNKRVDFARGVLAQAGIAERFELVLGGDSLSEKKPSAAQLEAAAGAFGVAASNAVLVGDSDQDFQAAKAAGWPFVWAAYGYRGGLETQDGHRVLRLDAFAQLPGLLARLEA